jgi:predicted dehydrogenase
MDKLRIGIIGCAGISWKQFIPAIALAKNAELVAISSRSAEKCSDFSAKYNIPLAFDSYEALLDADKIDAVYIPLPNALHKEWSIKAANAGKHILCEKPLAVTAEECVEMGKAAEANNVLLMEAFMYRFHPVTARIFRDVQEGILGGLETVQAVHSFLLTDENNIRLSREMHGGSLMDVGCYCVNVVRMLLNEEPTAVSALAHYHPHGVDDQMNILAKFASGRSAILSSGLTSSYPSGYTVSGRNGYYHAHYGFHLGVSAGTVTSNINGISNSINDQTNEYTCMIEHFADCVLNGTPLRYDYHDAAKNMAFINAALKSAKRNGEWEEVKQ